MRDVILIINPSVSMKYVIVYKVIKSLYKVCVW